MRILCLSCLSLLLALQLWAQETQAPEHPGAGEAHSTGQLHEFLDLQMHPCMHMTYRFFGKGFEFFEEGQEPKLSHKHQLKNVNFANYWKQNAGARIIVAGALNKEGIKNPAKAKRQILEQLEYINNFAAENSDHFAVAKTPVQLRGLVATTDKTIIVHSVEGARRLVNSQADADFWAEQGVAFMTLIHLRDTELGSSAVKPGFMMKLINLPGALKKQENRVGLTELGKQTISWLACAGIMTDITHMSDQCRNDALDYMEQNGIPPISTHDLYRPIQNHPRGLSRQQIIRIYKNKGFVSLPISGESLMPYKPESYYQNLIDTLSNHCVGSIDSYQLTYQEVKNLIESNYAEILGSKASNFSELSDAEKVCLSIGFQSDFNGWLNHSRPRYGKQGCFELEEGQHYEPIEIDGMPHPAYLESHWNYLENHGVDLQPVKRNAERFAQLWERFRSQGCR